MEAQVREFHERFGFALDKNLSEESGSIEASAELDRCTSILERMAKDLKPLALINQETWNDIRLWRFQLILEELSETGRSLVNGNQLECADALVDLLYVVVGTMITYKIPVKSLFDEIHRSNMTKSRKSDDPRMKYKGPDYSPPNLERLLS